MRLIASVLSLVLVLGCGDDSESDPEPSDDAAVADASSNENDDKDPPAKPTREVPCTDQSVSTLMLYDKPASGLIREEKSSPEEFVTAIDATGGGLNATESFMYARFTADGLKKVNITDEEAFTSLEWDIAFRRYVVRLNSGVSGPGEVTAGRTAPMTQFLDLTEAPENIEYRTEEYFIAEGCEFVADTSGIGAPATALSSFWTYSSCVQMTKNVYVISLPEDRQVKFEVLSYYTVDNQRTCDQTGKVPMPSGAGNIRIRWSFL